jgi:hypothetical protein
VTLTNLRNGIAQQTDVRYPAVEGRLTTRRVLVMPSRSDPLRLYQARLDGVVGRVQGLLWTADVRQLRALREDWPRLAEALDELVAVLDSKPKGPPLFD